jgi:signal transduction histidine kinase/ActR/RegA family two-component response regulator
MGLGFLCRLFRIGLFCTIIVMSKDTILIIDDNKDLAEDLAELLEPRGFSPQVAHTASEGLALARRSSFTVALVDMRLPDSIGVDLLEALKEASPFGEVIFMTAFASIETAIRAVSGGAYGYVQKPFEVKALMELVERARRQALADLENSRLRTLAESILRSSPGLAWVFSREGGLEAAFGGSSVLPAAPPLGTKPEAIEDAFIREMVSADGVIERHGVRYPTAALDLWAGPLTGIDNNQRRLFVIRDATTRVEAESKAQLSQQLAALGEMAKTLAHEISNPLAAIQLQLDVAESALDVVPTERRELVQGPMTVAHKEVDRLSSLLQDFLDFARPDSLQKEPTELGSLCNEVVILWKPRFQSKNLSILLEAPKSLPLVVVDPGKIRQVLLNLVKNAHEALPSGGCCRVKLWSDAKEIFLLVSDDGPGIPPKILSLPGTTTKTHGSGLGLSLIRRIVENHEGTLQIKTSAESGTEVLVSLRLE